MLAERLAQLETARDVSQLLEELYGVDPAAAVGVVQVAAVWRSSGSLRVLRIQEATPKSPLDFFLLNVARARAEAIVTTGKILRDEPDVQHGLAGPGAAALERWRRERVGLGAPPLLLILTSGRGLDLAHPALQATVRPLLYTSRESAAVLDRSAAGGRVDIVGDSEPSVRRAIALLRSRGYKAISIEAGPSTARQLYEPPLVIDEIALSCFLGPDLPPGVAGGELLTAEALDASFYPVAEPPARQEASGRWSFCLYRRRRAVAPRKQPKGT